jgi:hypothetical protein
MTVATPDFQSFSSDLATLDRLVARMINVSETVDRFLIVRIP